MVTSPHSRDLNHMVIHMASQVGINSGKSMDSTAIWPGCNCGFLAGSKRDGCGSGELCRLQRGEYMVDGDIVCGFKTLRDPCQSLSQTTL